MLDILKSILNTQQWWRLAVFDIRQRYRRSVLGPLWITITTGVMVLALGVLWSTLFKSEVHDFMPYFAAGLVVWNFMSAQINESCTGYTQFEGYIKQIYLPFPLYILRIWARNLIFLAHNLLVVVVVWLYFGMYWLPNFPLLIVGLVLLSLIVLFLSIPIAVICTRYRDITPIVQSVVQIAYFFTPIMWQVQILPQEYLNYALYNPLHHLLDIVRAPLIGHAPAMVSWYWAIGSLVFAVVSAWFFHTRYRRRIAYWL